MDVHKQLYMHNPDLFCDRILQLVPREDNFISMLGDYFEKQ